MCDQEAALGIAARFVLFYLLIYPTRRESMTVALATGCPRWLPKGSIAPAVDGELRMHVVRRASALDLN